MAATAPKTESYFPLGNTTQDGYTKGDRASATCYCGKVQIDVPLTAPGLVGTFACRCTDCRKMHSSFGATNFTVRDEDWHYVRGEDNLTVFEQTVTIPGGHKMTNHFCKTCGVIIRRFGSRFPGVSFLRTGTVDDFTLHETVLKPQREVFVEDRVTWNGPVDGAEQVEGM
ncbi:hypothetical protein Q5752_004871 [Cryptotrichosporon argae]